MQRPRTEEEKPWDPLSISEVAALFAEADFPWWLGGGYAIEQFVGVSFRPHGDIDVLILRRDAASVRDLLHEWDLWAADPPGTLRPWRQGELLPSNVFDVWCRRHAGDDWRFQLMLDDADGDVWISRRSIRVSLPIEELGFRGPAGIPTLKPEVQLFYKAKAPRPKDVQDFERCLPRLTREQCDWLRRSIATAYGEHNRWLVKLST